MNKIDKIYAIIMTCGIGTLLGIAAALIYQIFRS